jgi:hypothetical protein
LAEQLELGRSSAKRGRRPGPQLGPAQLGDADAQPFPGGLNERVVLRTLACQHDRQAGHAFAPDQANLDARLAAAVGYDRREAGLDEIYLIDAPVADLEPLTLAWNVRLGWTLPPWAA